MRKWPIFEMPLGHILTKPFSNFLGSEFLFSFEKPAKFEKINNWLYMNPAVTGPVRSQSMPRLNVEIPTQHCGNANLPLGSHSH